MGFDPGARLARLLDWMEGQDFAGLVRSGLLKDVEEIVVDAHRRLYEARRKPWSPPTAYRWLRYEDPAPVTRLAEGVRKLRKRGAAFDAEAVDKACAKTPKGPDLN
ncbi:MAG: hypothetical protein E6I61_10955 [Chloroflexi bacterium]|nr:MAG: hypothetical protein E6J08_10690 [Chloroflexota bacterium]TME01572.1 MAG: hypothetical protein E6I71_15455 [Chloroflexota bacterium]TME39733.1 MAG: hypothetical protein E6I61_10955 [Chloroflexota bacterium]TME53447.1 MAG: hypothetical protein E6I53_03365 [Chloroflexota bacterium]